jgi:hypothetical protein
MNEQEQEVELGIAERSFKASQSDVAIDGAITTFLHKDQPRVVQAYGRALQQLIEPEPWQRRMAKAVVQKPQAVDETLLIASNGNCSWSEALSTELNEELAKAQHEYVLVKGSDTLPPGILKVPSADDVKIVELFGLPKLSQLATAKVADTLLHHYPGGYGDPPVKWGSDDDAYFVEQRMMGVNPCALTMISDEVRNLFSLGEGTHYMCDYKPLEPFSRKLAEAKDPAYIPAPICIFKYDEAGKSMQPVAILLDRAAGTPQVVYRDNDEPLKWRYAKMCVRTADWNAHELGSHLTLAHFVSEVACVVTHRCLPRHHPVFQLLLPHFFRTLPLNAHARSALVPFIIASGLSAFDEGQCFAFCAAIFKDWRFDQHYVPVDLANRGVADLPLKVYPYATTAKAVWNCIYTYVDSLLTTLAEVDPSKSLLDDYYLRDWCKQMRDSMPGFPLYITDPAHLSEVLTMIIYTATHQHAAVHNFQRKYMTFLPASPGFLANPPPADLNDLTEESLWDALPRKSRTQRALVDMLSEIPDTEHCLSSFDLATSPEVHYVQWKSLRNLLGPFQAELARELSPYDPDVVVSTTNLAQSVLL